MRLGQRSGRSKAGRDFDIDASTLQLQFLQEVGGIGAWNVRGLLSSTPKLRRAKLAVANQFLHGLNVAIFLESHGTHFDCEQVFDGYDKFCSLHMQARGGVMICLRQEWLQSRHIDYINLVRGRLARVRLTSPLFGEIPMISIYAVYLEPETNQFHDQILMLDTLHQTVEQDESVLKIMIGDWYFESLVCEVDDAPSLSYAHSRLLRRFRQLFPG